MPDFLCVREEIDYQIQWDFIPTTVKDARYILFK